jgi:hypothetical protein
VKWRIFDNRISGKAKTINHRWIPIRLPFRKLRVAQGRLRNPEENPLNPTPISTLMRQTHANLGWIGICKSKPFGILVKATGGRGIGIFWDLPCKSLRILIEWRGEISDPEIPRDRLIGRPINPRQLRPDSSNPRQSGMTWDDWGGGGAGGSPRDRRHRA